MIEKIEAGLAERWEDISRWFQGHLERAPAPVYASVDIRNSGFKLSVVDTNLFPAGFNNLCQRCFVNGPELFRKYFQERYGQVQNILIVPEDYTRNLPYFANVARITSILLKAGYNVRVGFVSADLRDDIYELILPSGETVCLYRIFRQDSEIWVEDFRPDLLLINNDFTTEVPAVLKGIAQPLVPPLEMGWHLREKSHHFRILHQLLQEFCQLLGWDPWFLTPITEDEREINFRTKEGLDRLASKVDSVIARIKAKYEEYEIEEEPYVFIKNNAGTYGIAIMTAASGQEVLNIKHKERIKMRRGKGGAPVTSVIIQEGVPTRDRFGECYVEPVIYMIGGEVVGGFLRENCRVSPKDNFNTLGMTFTRPCLHGLEEDEATRRCKRLAQPDYFPMIYDVISRIASLAAGYEIKEIGLGKIF